MTPNRGVGRLPRRKRQLAPTRGQSTVEFALIVPLVVIVLLAAIQVGLVGYSQLETTHLAREVARTLAVDPTADIGRMVESRSSLGEDDLSIQVQFEPTVDGTRETVLVMISYRVAPIIGLFAPFSASFTVRSEVRMLVES